MAKSKLYSDPKFMERLNYLIYIKNDLTARRVANAIGCERKTVYGWMNGVSAPNMIYVVRLCRLFNVSADWLMGLRN